MNSEIRTQDLGSSARTIAFVLGGSVLAIVVLFAVLYYSSAPYQTLLKCDEAIQSQLKAPSTYERIDSMNWAADANNSFQITYDAQNSFGVPLRGKGVCTVSANGQADWEEWPS